MENGTYCQEAHAKETLGNPVVWGSSKVNGDILQDGGED